MIRHIVALGILAAVLFVTPPVKADSVTWTLTDLIFADEATATGSFVYDASTNTVTSIDIVTSRGTLFAGAIYTALDPGYGPYSFDMAFVTSPGLSDYTATTALEFQTIGDVPLTDLGGVIPVDINEFICTDATCSTAAEVRGTLYGGELVGVVNTPEPSTIALLSIALLGLTAFARRNPLSSALR